MPRRQRVVDGLVDARMRMAIEAGRIFAEQIDIGMSVDIGDDRTFRLATRIGIGAVNSTVRVLPPGMTAFAFSCSFCVFGRAFRKRSDASARAVSISSISGAFMRLPSEFVRTNHAPAG